MAFNLWSFPSGNLEGIRVSVIIPALNEEKVLGRCLGSLTQQDFPREAFEVILVDNGSTDSTIETARTFSKALNLTVLQQKGVHISALRNLGASQARGQLFAFLDADCLAPPEWLTRAIALLEDKGVGVVGAHYRIPDDSKWVARAWYGGLEIEKQGELSWVPAGDLLVTRSIFERVGGFDESIETNEDCEFCDRVRAAGLKVIGDPEIAVVHLGTPQTLSAFYRKIRWHATDGLRVFLRALQQITNPSPLLFGLYTLTCLIGAGVGTIFIFWHGKFDVFMVGLIALSLPSFFLSLRLVLRRKRWNEFVPLVVIYLTFGIARAQSLLAFRSWVGSRRAQR